MIEPFHVVDKRNISFSLKGISKELEKEALIKYKMLHILNDLPLGFFMGPHEECAPLFFCDSAVK